VEPPSPQVVTYALGGLLAALALYWRIRRMRRQRRLRVRLMWIMPLILATVTTLVIAPNPPQGLAWLWLLPAAALGGLAGWRRGKLVSIVVDPETETLKQQASPAAVLILLALMAVRLSLRALMNTEAQAYLDVAMITDAMMVFVTAMITVQRTEMFIRARRMLAEARAAKVGG